MMREVKAMDGYVQLHQMFELPNAHQTGLYVTGIDTALKAGTITLHFEKISYEGEAESEPINRSLQFTNCEYFYFERLTKAKIEGADIIGADFNSDDKGQYFAITCDQFEARIWYGALRVINK